MSIALDFTSSWKSASPHDLHSKQITSFLFPKRRFIARLKASTPHASVTLWRDQGACAFMYVTDQPMTNDDLARVLNLLSDIIDQDSSRDNQVIPKMRINLFAKSFDADFLSKLRFLAMPTQSFEWSLGTGDAADAILVREVHPSTDATQDGDATEKESSVSVDAHSSLLSKNEITAFAQLGVDLRRLQDDSHHSNPS